MRDGLCAPAEPLEGFNQKAGPRMREALEEFPRRFALPHFFDDGAENRPRVQARLESEG